MESKKVTYLRRLLTNGGRDHDGRGGASRLVAQAVQGAQESARWAPLPRPPSREWPRASFLSWGWAWCFLWLLQKRKDDGPALPCHGAAASACKGRQGHQHMTLACM